MIEKGFRKGEGETETKQYKQYKIIQNNRKSRGIYSGYHSRGKTETEREKRREEREKKWRKPGERVEGCVTHDSEQISCVLFHQQWRSELPKTQNKAKLEAKSDKRMMKKDSQLYSQSKKEQRIK